MSKMGFKVFRTSVGDEIIRPAPCGAPGQVSAAADSAHGPRERPGDPSAGGQTAVHSAQRQLELRRTEPGRFFEEFLSVVFGRSFFKHSRKR